MVDIQPIPEDVKGRVSKITQHNIYVTTEHGEIKLALSHVRFSNITEFTPKFESIVDKSK